MTILKVVFFCTDEYGCGTLFLREDDSVISEIDENDANWRHEYFDHILQDVGVQVMQVNFYENEEKYLQILKDFFGD